MGYTRAGGYAIPRYIDEDEDDCDETVNLLHDKVQFSLQVYLLKQLANTWSKSDITLHKKWSFQVIKWSFQMKWSHLLKKSLMENFIFLCSVKELG